MEARGKVVCGFLRGYCFDSFNFRRTLHNCSLDACPQRHAGHGANDAGAVIFQLDNPIIGNAEQFDVPAVFLQIRTAQCQRLLDSLFD